MSVYRCECVSECVHTVCECAVVTKVLCAREPLHPSPPPPPCHQLTKGLSQRSTTSMMFVWKEGWSRCLKSAWVCVRLCVHERERESEKECERETIVSETQNTRAPWPWQQWGERKARKDKRGWAKATRVWLPGTSRSEAVPNLGSSRRAHPCPWCWSSLAALRQAGRGAVSFWGATWYQRCVDFLKGS